MGKPLLKLMKILFEDCGQEPAEDRDLPNNSFLVEYKVDDVSHYDIAAAAIEAPAYTFASFPFQFVRSSS